MPYKIGMPTLLELPSIENTVSFCKELVLRLIELSMTRPEFLPISLSSSKLRRIMNREGIEFTLHLPEEIDLASFHDEVRDAWIRNMIKTLNWASDSGITNATMHLTNGIYYTMPGEKVWLYDEYCESYVQRIKGALDDIRSNTPGSICLCVENCGNFGLPFICRALDENDLHLTWDVGHDAESGFADSPYINAHLDRVRHIHLHDFDGIRAHQCPYSGQVNVDAALRFARERQLRVIVEVKTATALAESIKRLNTAPFSSF